MISKLVDQKASKLKFNVEGYLSNERKKDGQHSLSSRREQSMGHSQPGAVPLSLNHSSSSSKPSEFDIKSLIIQGKTYDRPGTSMRPVKKDKELHIYFTEDSSKYKIELKTTPENGFVVRRDPDKSLIELHFKKADKKKSFRPQENTGESKWMQANEIKEDKVVMVMANKEVIKSLHKTIFEGLAADEQFKNMEEQKTVEEKQSAVVPQAAVEEEPGESENVRFVMPSEQQLNETEKFRKSIKDMKEDDKIYVMSEIFKIKKEYEDIERKRLKCPVFTCQKHYREISQLKVHLKKNHPELNKHGIELTEFGTFEYSSKALDLALYLGKIYPAEMKKIIKKMKTKAPTD